MIRVLVIGLLWLSCTGVMCLLIGRAIRSADVHDEHQAQSSAVGRRTGSVAWPVAGGEAQATLCAPDLDSLVGLPELGGADDGRRGPYSEPAPDFPWPERHPDRPRGTD